MGPAGSTAIGDQSYWEVLPELRGHKLSEASELILAWGYVWLHRPGVKIY